MWRPVLTNMVWIHSSKLPAISSLTAIVIPPNSQIFTRVEICGRMRYGVIFRISRFRGRRIGSNSYPRWPWPSSRWEMIATRCSMGTRIVRWLMITTLATKWSSHWWIINPHCWLPRLPSRMCRGHSRSRTGPPLRSWSAAATAPVVWSKICNCSSGRWVSRSRWRGSSNSKELIAILKSNKKSTSNSHNYLFRMLERHKLWRIWIGMFRM